MVERSTRKSAAVRVERDARRDHARPGGERPAPRRLRDATGGRHEEALAHRLADLGGEGGRGGDAAHRGRECGAGQTLALEDLGRAVQTRGAGDCRVQVLGMQGR